MTSEQRRYERLLARQHRGQSLSIDELKQLNRDHLALPLALREHALLNDLKNWFTAAPSDDERQKLARLERAAVVRARHNSRASLRLLVPGKSIPQPRSSRCYLALRRMMHSGWSRVALTFALVSASALAFNTTALNGLFRPTSSPSQQPIPLVARPQATCAQLSRIALLDSTSAMPELPNKALDPAPARAPNVVQVNLRASELLNQARQALQQRDVKRALNRYRELLHHFPHSSEAASVRITVAQLELQIGSAKTALLGFERYLRHGGSLLPEALAGKIQALTALGRHSQAKQTMREYLVRFPNEVHSRTYRRAVEL